MTFANNHPLLFTFTQNLKFFGTGVITLNAVQDLDMYERFKEP